MEDIKYNGSIIEIAKENSKSYYLLAEYFGNDFLFQVIRLDGYHRGNIVGYIRMELELQKKSIRGVSNSFLKEEFSKNVLSLENANFNVIDVLPNSINLS